MGKVLREIITQWRGAAGLTGIFMSRSRNGRTDIQFRALIAVFIENKDFCVSNFLY